MFGVKDGFDVVIGNPPYVEHKKLKEIASKFRGKYEVYSGTADLSIYFIEAGIKLCKGRGFLIYITTNKFFNTGYGKLVRAYILKNQLDTIIDFEQVEVFENALISSVILGVRKSIPSIDEFCYQKFYKLNSSKFKNEFGKDNKYFGIYRQSLLGEDEWSFADTKQLALKEKIETSARCISELEGVSVCRGVTTGYNPAFIIDNEKRKELINADKKSEGIIKPLLQGRNIRKWIYNESNEHLIFTKQGIKIEHYEKIKQYLHNFYSELRPRTDDKTGAGRKPGDYKWYEIQDNTAYYSEFEKEKIIWGLTADKWAFAYDDQRHYLPSNGYILTSTKIPVKYLLAILNSTLMKYYFSFIGVMTAGGAYTLKHATIQQLPIKIAKNTKPFIDLVDNILAAKANGAKADTSALERQIDNLVYRLYDLTPEEIKIVEGN
jgi:hypothetical protein